MLRTHTRNLYMNAMYCPRLRRLGRAAESDACNVIVLDPTRVINEMQINFNYRQIQDEKFMAQKLLEKVKSYLR